MSWRTVYISKQCHLSFKNNYLIIKGDEITRIFIPEINMVLIDNNMSSISIYLINELVKNKVKIVFCDSKHNPSSELISLNGSYDSARVIAKETCWEIEKCDYMWQLIVKKKILEQVKVLELFGKKDTDKLIEYANNVQVGDTTNREGHAAKVYFHSLFGEDFDRNQNNNINAYLDYGYTVLLSTFNREIVSLGYITQIGIHHKGPRNPFNLSCDLMEPFRPLVDVFAYRNRNEPFLKDKKYELLEYLNGKFEYKNKSMYLNNIINDYISDIFMTLEQESVSYE